MKSFRFIRPGSMDALIGRARSALPGLVSSRVLPHVIAILSLGLLALVSFLLWAEMTRRFPRLEPGSYFGSISGVFSSAGLESRFYVEYEGAGSELVLVVPRPGWSPQAVPVGDPSAEAIGELTPLTIPGPDGALRFIGSRSGPGEYVGGVVNLDTGLEGSWRLSRVEAAPTDTSRDVEIRHWLALKGELADVVEEIKSTERRVPAQKTEIEKLTKFIEERERLRSSADGKFEEVKEALRVAQAELNALQGEARALEAELELAQRFTGMGRLVSLSRESLEREGRWLDSMLRSDVVSSQPDIEVAAERAAKIVKLKREIAVARAALADRSAPRDGAEGGER